MVTPNEHAVGLRELRHRTSEVLARVRHGETIDVTEYGRLVLRSYELIVGDLKSLSA